jgi:MFS family permease
MPTWRKWVFAVILSIFSCTGLQVVSGAGSLISFFLMDYIEAGKGYQDIVNLITIPTLSMGLGNFIFVPISLAIGRRPVYLFSGALLFLASVIAANNTSYEYHLAARIVIGFAAGQSEALVPLML